LSEPAPAGGFSEARIAEAIARGETPATAAPTGARDIVYHEVAADETLFSVARRYGVSVETLAKWNAISGPAYSVTAGQVLTIPVEDAAAIAGTGANLVQTPPGAGAPIPVPASASDPLPRDTLAVKPIASPELGQYQQSTLSTATITPPALAEPTAPPEPVTPIPTAASQAADAGDSGRFTAPVPGPIVIPYNRTAGAKQNDGVDFAAQPGDAVMAAGDGTVALVSTSLGDWGSIVLIRHGTEYMTVYGRLGTVAVTKGQAIKRGDTVGAVAAPNEGERPMMHFEVRRGAFSEDPTTFF
jgi:murein DD-endopeptidase MepM/ murein hydrolase activator NlpD